MAKTLLGDLFPASTKLCRDLAPWLYEKIFPPLGPLCERTTFAADVSGAAVVLLACFAVRLRCFPSEVR